LPSTVPLRNSAITAAVKFIQVNFMGLYYLSSKIKRG
jgi:hypothetical protein